MSTDNIEEYTGAKPKPVPVIDNRWICENQKCRCRNSITSNRCLACGKVKTDAQA